MTIVVQAVVLAGRALHHRALVWLAVAAFLMLAVLGLPFPLVVLGAGAVGWALGRWRPEVMARPAIADGDDDEPPLVPDDALHRARPSARRNLAILAGGLTLWVVPVAAAWALASGSRTVFTDQGLFFGGMALVTFGGAYVLAYVAQGGRGDVRLALGRRDGARARAGRDHPGPLIMVVQFVAFLGAYHHPGDLDPWLAAVLGSMLTVWVTFVRASCSSSSARPTSSGSATATRSRRPDRRDRGGRRGDRQPRRLLRRAHALRARPRCRSGRSTSTCRCGRRTSRSFPITAVAMVLVFGLKWSVLRTLGACALLGLVVSYLF